MAPVHRRHWMVTKDIPNLDSASKVPERYITLLKSLGFTRAMTPEDVQRIWDKVEAEAQGQ